MSENTDTSGFDAAVSFFGGSPADSDGAPRTEARSKEPEVEGDKPEAREEKSVKTPVENDEFDAATEGDSTSNDDDTDGEPDAGDDGIADDGSTSEEPDEKEAERGRLRFEDYTRKTQELAEKSRHTEELRAALEQELAEIRYEREWYSENLPIVQQMVAGPQVTEQELEMLRVTNPEAFAQVFGQFQKAQQEYSVVQAEQERLAKIAHAQEIEQTKAYLASERELLLQKRPEWNDPAVFKEAKVAMRAYARNVLGYSEDDLNSVLEHRAVLALADAAENHQVRSMKGEPAKSSTARVAPGSSTATHRKASARDTAFKRHQDSNTLASAAEAFKYF